MVKRLLRTVTLIAAVIWIRDHIKQWSILAKQLWFNKQ